MILTLALALSGSTSTGETVDAKTCLVHLELLIADAERESGRVAGPTFFIHDFWRERADEEGASEEAESQALRDRLVANRAQAPAAFEADRRKCVDEAISLGAVPGLSGE